MAGCVLSSPTKWRGQHRLEACPANAIDLIGSIPGVHYYENKYNKKLDGWYVPQSVLDMGRYPAEMKSYVPEQNNRTPSGLTLYEHQARAVTFFRNVTPEREGAICASAPGDGKTIITLQALWLQGLLYEPGLVIAPNIAKPVWCDADSDPFVHYGLRIIPLEGLNPNKFELPDSSKTIFASFEILQAWQPWIFQFFKPRWLIIDEIHYLTNMKAQRSKAAVSVAMSNTILVRYGLTGTPIPNRRLELWSELVAVQPRQWGSTHSAFGRRYCGGRQDETTGFWIYDGESNTTELRARLAGTLLYSNAEEFSGVLPPLERHIVRMDIAQPELLDEYSMAQRDVIKYLRMKGKLEGENKEIQIGNSIIKVNKNERAPKPVHLICLTTLIGILSQAKLYGAVEAIKSIMALHDRLVVFTWRRETADAIVLALIKIMGKQEYVGGKWPRVFGPIDGEMSLGQRKAWAKEFASTQCAVYVATRDSAGTSINDLKAASAVLLVDLHWNISNLRQAEKRVHRTGCTAAKVDAYYLVADRTVDDLFLSKIEDKAKLAVSISESDNSGMQLVQDLIPDRAKEGIDFEELCQRLMDMD